MAKVAFETIRKNVRLVRITAASLYGIRAGKPEPCEPGMLLRSLNPITSDLKGRTGDIRRSLLSQLQCNGKTTPDLDGQMLAGHIPEAEGRQLQSWKSNLS